ncbi:hypothetical protein AQUCO_07400062v1 [Aquilegia coerulea]|uniref:Transposase Tnp1/En/Spm-like domain-containing protein n=1 Tax=Aquilegia coerulea TaxID=218851 RepID=A0A2G5CAT0_AQUCA|nr:hypothetical protein AQUCO_07400062v1 [Aquilegia coerulea]
MCPQPDPISVFYLGLLEKLDVWWNRDKIIAETLNKCTEISNKVESLEGIIKELRSTYKADSNAVGEFLRLLQEELKKESKPSLTVQFFQDDTTIYVAKIALVGAIGYGVWKWMGYSVSDIVNGTKRNVAGALSCMTENLGKKSAKISEKMRNLSEQLENCGKQDEPKKTSNLKKKVSEVDRDISRSGNLLDLNKKPHDLTPLENMPCKLFRMDEQDIVAEAIWMTDDPTTLVHGRELGRKACKVWVTNAVDPNAKVWRPTFGIQKMEEAIKTNIAWPADHILYDVHVHYDDEAGGSGYDPRI